MPLPPSSGRAVVVPPPAVTTRLVTAAKLALAHTSARMTSPGATPVARSASSAACNKIAAAARSTTLRCAAPEMPRSRKIRPAETVVRRSSTSRTGTGAKRLASGSANCRAARTAGPALPDSEVGSPTTTSMASCSATRSATRSRSPRARRTVVNGVARTPPGSHRATPIRTVPTSIPSRTPGRGPPALTGCPGHAGPRRARPRGGHRRPHPRPFRRPGLRRPCPRRRHRGPARPRRPAPRRAAPAHARPRSR